MSSPGTSLDDRILRARTVGGVPPDRLLASPSTIPDLMAERAAEAPDAPWLVYRDEAGHRTEFSRARMLGAVRGVAALLRREGVGRGDRVATVAHNHSDTVIQYLACWSIGAVVVPVNAGEDDRRIAFILSDSGARLAFVRTEYEERMAGIAAGMAGRSPAVRTIVVGRPGGPFELALEGDGEGRRGPGTGSGHTAVAPAAASAESPGRAGGSAGVSPHDEALIVYTSGTTGNPKGVLLSQYNLLVDAMAIAAWHGMRPGERMMCVLPIHHVNGIVVTLVTPLWYGGSVALLRKFRTEDFWTTIAAEGVGVVSVVPTLLQFLVHAGPVPEGTGLRGLRHVICGAGPLTCELAAAFENAFGVPIVHGYGLSETTCYSCFLPVDLPAPERSRWLREHGFPSIGVPLPVNEMAIHDGDGRELPDGERGEIVIRGHNVMLRYFAGPEVNDPTFAHGWFRSGDEGFRLRDGRGRPFFFITGRLKELIIRGGVNISPFEIDEVLMNLPGVSAGLAVGFENDWYGEEVGAYVRRAPGSAVTEEEVLAACRAAFPYAKCPKVVVFGEEIPVTSTGKYQRGRLRPLFERWKTVQFSERPRRQ